MHVLFMVGWMAAFLAAMVVQVLVVKRGGWDADSPATMAEARRIRPLTIILGVVGLGCLLGAFLTG